MRAELPLREITTEEIWIEVQRLRSEMESHSHLGPGAGSTLLSGVVEGSLQSPNFVSGSVGWKIWPSGTVQFYDGVFTGTITATAGAIGNWTINATSIYTGTEDHSGYTANAGDLTIYSSGTDASIHAKLFYIDTAGVLNCSAAVIGGSTISTPTITGIQAGSEIAIQGWQSTLVFAASDYRTVGWSVGNDETITLLDGTIYTFTAGNTGNMAALTYIYLNIDASTTVLQTSVTASDAVGTGKILVGIAQNNADTSSNATYQIYGGTGGEMLGVDYIAANSTSTNEFVANTANIKDAIITNAKVVSMEVSKLTAGTITSKAITLAVSAGVGDTYIAAGKTDFTNTDSGFILGLDDSDSDLAKFYIGTSSVYFNWTGAAMTLVGATLTAGTIQTASSGARIVLDSGTPSFILYDSGDAIIEMYTGYPVGGMMKMEPHSDVRALHIANDAAHQSTKTLVYFATNKSDSTGTTLGAGNAGLGYSASFDVTNNASRVNPTVYVGAVAGQGAHIGMNPIATVPQTPAEGELYANTDHKLYYYNGTTQIDLTAQGFSQSASGTDSRAGNTGAGTQVITVGFLAKVIKIYAIRGDSDSQRISWSNGSCDSALAQNYVAGRIDPSITYSFVAASYIILVRSHDNNSDIRADISAIGATTFTINWEATPNDGQPINFLWEAIA